ncbi:hypothetical protein Ancab_014159 [Ancistrocladus abbreviatus]
MMLKLRFSGVCFTYCFRSLIHYSTASTTTDIKVHFMVDYLVKSLGFSNKEAVSTLREVSHFESAKQPDSVVNFLKQVGFDKTQVKNTVYSSPTILSKSVDKTLKPKIKVFQDFGFSGSQLAELLSTTPVILLWPINAPIKQALEVLKTFFSDNEDLIKAVKRSQWMLSANVNKYLLPNVVLLQKYGLSEEKIKKQLRERPRCLLQRTKWLEDVLARVEVDLGIPRKSAMFVHGFHVLASLNPRTLESKFQVFKSYGWTESDILTMARKLPYCLRTSDTKIRLQLDFLMKELGYGPAFLSNHPTLLKYSLEKRVFPRIAVLQALRYQKLMDTDCKLYTALNLSEYRFIKKFVLPFKDKLPDICEDYMNSTGSSMGPAE